VSPLSRITIKKGLDIPLAGAPEQRLDDGNQTTSVALLGADIVGLRPRMQVEPGDAVRLGQTLFTDRQNPEIQFTAPGAGIVEAVNRGARRSLQSVVIRLDGDEAESYLSTESPGAVKRRQVIDNLIASGLWTAFRTRPFSRIPAPGDEPAAIFVTAIDTNPHAANPAIAIDEDADAFADGLHIIRNLTDGTVHVCTAPDSGIPVPRDRAIRLSEFAGPHPAGLVGTHIHFLDPVGRNRTVWHVGYQDVMAIGRQFASGRLSTERVVALGGPLARSPRLLRTRLGASISDLVADEIQPSRLRLVSGSVLNGRRAVGPIAWLGRYHVQVSALAEGSDREFLAWARPGTGKYSAIRAFAGHLFHRGDFSLSTSQNGSPRAMVSIGSFERVMPLDILATPLLKALLVKDTDSARDLGCLELDEEDLALCSFVCNGKYEYGPFLRESLTEIEVNG
jgi:Na+-transporting NADH:ubiquinone oxidoreductase subunit A